MVKVTIHGQRDDSEIHAGTHNGHTWIEGADATSGAVLHVHIGQARQIATLLCRAFDFTAADLGIEQAAPVGEPKEPPAGCTCKRHPDTDEIVQWVSTCPMHGVGADIAAGKE